jgi:methionyl-tRNA formyltransferase
MKILILGSSYLTEKVTEHLQRRHKIVGYVPCDDALVPGKMPVLKGDMYDECDIRLAIQYSRPIPADCLHNAFGIHTGLLPDWGGRDILWHTVEQGATHQGATLHKLVEERESGPIISYYAYPCFHNDTVKDLYGRLAKSLPRFTLMALEMLEDIGWERAIECARWGPTMYSHATESVEYKAQGREIKDEFTQ